MSESGLLEHRRQTDFHSLPTLMPSKQHHSFNTKEKQMFFVRTNQQVSGQYGTPQTRYPPKASPWYYKETKVQEDDE